MFLSMNITSIFCFCISKYCLGILTIIFDRDTYVERKPGESANDRNDRAIRKACSWYQTHLEESQKGTDKKKQIKVVLLTQDFKNREQACNEGIPTYKGKQHSFKPFYLLADSCDFQFQLMSM